MYSLGMGKNKQKTHCRETLLANPSKMGTASAVNGPNENNILQGCSKIKPSSHCFAKMLNTRIPIQFSTRLVPLHVTHRYGDTVATNKSKLKKVPTTWRAVDRRLCGFVLFGSYDHEEPIFDRMQTQCYLQVLPWFL